MTCTACGLPVPELGGMCSLGERQFCSRRCRDRWTLDHAAELDAEAKRLRVALNAIYLRCRRGTVGYQLAREALWPNSNPAGDSP